MKIPKFKSDLLSFKQFITEDIIDETIGIKNMYVYSLLNEGIAPVVTKYGTDFENGEWLNLPRQVKVTFFEANNNFFAVIYRNGFIGFATNYKDANKKDLVLTNIKSIKNIDQLFLNYHFNQTDIPNAIAVFNKSFYVMLVAIHHFKPVKIQFDGYSKKLKDFYEILTKNKNFINTVCKYGYVYSGIETVGEREFITFITYK